MDARNNRSDFQLTLPSDYEIRLTRSFSAPRELVWIATTQPEHVKRWWSCDRFALTVCDIDLRVGGGYRYVMPGRDGSEHRFKGVYREVIRPQRLVYTQIYDVESYADREAIVVTTFDEKAGRTLYTSIITHLSREDRDNHIASGMEAGSAIALDRLADLLLTLT
ncbi:SRPBCC family protein [Bradyrhizobium prioriisuperbiae]|uniref:SRPBCC family protein n=1 Tax=Bradyrhizobium prioriisuperbiae TaxID=2854389 RepID=UPI0028EB5757|nr:SRPBCC family protein [Bradyrhizobium prioritasuperba]